MHHDQFKKRFWFCAIILLKLPQDRGRWTLNLSNMSFLSQRWLCSSNFMMWLAAFVKRLDFMIIETI